MLRPTETDLDRAEDGRYPGLIHLVIRLPKLRFHHLNVYYTNVSSRSPVKWTALKFYIYIYFCMINTRQSLFAGLVAVFAYVASYTTSPFVHFCT